MTVGLATAGLAAVPSVATAADYYVTKTGNDANPCSQPQPCLTIQHAVGLTGASGDSVHIGPGFYAEAVSTATKNVTLEGAGGGAPDGFNPSTDTYVHPTTSDYALRMQGGGTVRGMKLEGASDPAIPKPALFMSALVAGSPLTYVAEDVVATGGLFNGGDSRETGIQIDDGPTSRDVLATVRSSHAPFLGGPGISADGANVAALIVQSSIFPLSAQHQSAVVISGGAAGVLDRSIVGDNFPISAGVLVKDAGSFGGIFRSTLRVQGGPLQVTTDMPGTVRGTVLDSDLVNISTGSSGGFAVEVANNSLAAGSHSLLTLRNSTVAAQGAAPAALVVGMRVDGPSVQGSSAEATAQNSVLRAINTADPSLAFDLQATTGYGVFTAESSSFTNVSAGLNTTITAPGSGANLTGDPGFVNPAAGNYSLVPGSPLVDRGDPAFASPNELDLDGGPRSVDGNGDCIVAPDMGAHERPAVACPGAAPSGGGGAGGSSTTTTPGSPAGPGIDLPASIDGFGLERQRFAVARGATAVAGRKRAAKGSAFRYTISEDASARIAIERAGPGLRSGKRCAKPTRKLRRRHAKRCTRYTSAGTLTRAAKQGTNRHPFTGRIGRRPLKPGRYRATITATDPAGNVSAARTATFAIVGR
jgi:hypothetical protein